MPEDNWKFDPDELSESTEEQPTASSTSNPASSMNPALLVMLPITAAGAFAFVEKAATLAALEGLLGAGGLALVITQALWVVGVLTVAAIGMVVAIAIGSLIVGLITRNGLALSISALSGLYLGVGYWGATTFFAGLPLLVGFVLAANLIVWAVSITLLTLAALGAIALAASA